MSRRCVAFRATLLLACCVFLPACRCRRPLEKGKAKGIAACLAVKGPEPDLREWIEHQRELGVSKAIVMDNNSSEPLFSEVADFVKDEFVQYHYLKGTGLAHPQFDIYNRCIKLYRDDFEWMIFIDSDEYLVVPGNKTLAQILAQYAGKGGLAINWRQVGPSGHDRRPEGGVRANYHKCYAETANNNRHVKTIANMRGVSHSNGAHAFKYLPGYGAVNTRGEPQEGPFSSPPDFSQLYLYHYVTRSRQDFENKMFKGSGARNYKPASFFDLVARDCTAECTALLPANSTIRARLAAPAPPEARPESVLQLPTTLPAQPERPSDAKA